MVKPFNIPIPWKKKPPPITPPAPPTTPQPIRSFPGIPKQPGAAITSLTSSAMSTDATQVPYINPNNAIAVSNKELIKELFLNLIEIKTKKGVSAEELNDTLANAYNTFEGLTGGKASPRLREVAAHLFFNTTIEIYADKPDVTEAYKGTRTMIREQLFPDVDAIKKIQYWEAFPNADLSMAKKAFFQDKDIPYTNFLVKQEILKSFDPQMLRIALDPEYARRQEIGKTPPNEKIEAMMKDIQAMWVREMEIDRIWGRTPEILKEDLGTQYQLNPLDRDLNAQFKRQSRANFQTTPSYTTKIIPGEPGRSYNQKYWDGITKSGGVFDLVYDSSRLLGDIDTPYDKALTAFNTGGISLWDYDAAKKNVSRLYSMYHEEPEDPKKYLGDVDWEKSVEPEDPEVTPRDLVATKFDNYKQVINYLALVNASKYPRVQQADIYDNSKKLLEAEAKKMMPQDYEVANTSDVEQSFKDRSSKNIAKRLLDTGQKHNWSIPSISSFSYTPPAKGTKEVLGVKNIPESYRRTDRKVDVMRPVAGPEGTSFPRPPREIYRKEPY